MDLTVKERILLVGMLSTYQGDATSIAVLENLRGVLMITEDELDKYGFNDPNEEGMVKWNPDVPQEADIPISKRAERLIAGMIDKMGKHNQLTLEHASLCRKFLDMEDEDG